MNKKIYTAPKINVVEMCCTTIMAGSGGIEEDGTSVSGGLDSGSASSGGDFWGGAYSASRVYFDSWTDDPDDL